MVSRKSLNDCKKNCKVRTNELLQRELVEFGFHRYKDSGADMTY